jgi:hypothetical protein
MNQSPTITLIFKGLFLFAFEKDNRFCQAVIMQADRHCLKVTVKTNVASLKKPPELTFEVRDGDITIDVPTRPDGIDTYEAGVFDRNTNHDTLDFRWVLDLEGTDLHNRSLAIKAGSVKRSIFIRNGLFRNQRNRPITISSASTQPRTTSAAREIGCDIFLNKNENLVFSYGPNGDSSLTFNQETEVNYEIVIDNTCPEETDMDEEVSDFVHYYDVMNVPVNEQFRVDAFEPPPNDRRPCDPVYLSLSKAPLQ